jgi:hypothetical protein
MRVLSATDGTFLLTLPEAVRFWIKDSYEQHLRQRSIEQGFSRSRHYRTDPIFRTYHFNDRQER